MNLESANLSEVKDFFIHSFDLKNEDIIIGQNESTFKLNCIEDVWEALSHTGWLHNGKRVIVEWID